MIKTKGFSAKAVFSHHHRDRNFRK